MTLPLTPVSGTLSNFHFPQSHNKMHAFSRGGNEDNVVIQQFAGLPFHFSTNWVASNSRNIFSHRSPKCESHQGPWEVLREELLLPFPPLLVSFQRPLTYGCVHSSQGCCPLGVAFPFALLIGILITALRASLLNPRQSLRVEVCNLIRSTHTFFQRDI